MINDASSIAVLGNGRATDIPKIPGRAIWKNGMDMVEIQTPFLSAEEAEKLLEPPDEPTTSQNDSAKVDESARAQKPAQITKELIGMKRE